MRLTFSKCDKCHVPIKACFDLANFRPVSNLSFLSKVVERAVARQLNDHITKNGLLLPRCQSACRRHHSTETTMLRVVSDALTAADRRPAAVDCVDHQLLLQRLEKHCGLHGSVLRWMTSYLAGHTQKVLYSGLSSEANEFPMVYRKDPYWGRCYLICT